MIKRIKSKKGFTLADLMVSMTILGVMAGISVPVYTGIVEKVREKEAITNLYFIYRQQKKAFEERGTYVSLSGSGWTHYINRWNGDPHPARWIWSNNPGYYDYDFNDNPSGFIATAQRVGSTKQFSIDETGVITESGSN